jgi:aspartyl-tRNA(Asn)/glutamyl-tRNA(Gln) amidotransferase subunit C
MPRGPRCSRYDPHVIDDATVRHVARLARLHLDEDEERRMRVELSGILEHIDRIQALALGDVPPTTHVVEQENVLRDDEPRPRLPAEEALREAAEVVEGRFAVPKFE